MLAGDTDHHGGGPVGWGPGPGCDCNHAVCAAADQRCALCRNARESQPGRTEVPAARSWPSAHSARCCSPVYRGSPGPANSQLNLQRRSALIRVPLTAVLLTFFSHIARSYTSAFMNPSLAYGLTFHCPGFTFKEYAVVYWLSSLTGMMLALLLYMGHIPRLFAKNLLYVQKTRFRVPKGDKPEKKKN
ncbi:hypothetical protein XENORESO_013840 [Xenotaenia resolanae]|uniref:Aquaporin n=1 Tax=Xenotaenia resolanae TaxID=208358 RepID=A0ABV0WHS9_9TELE